MSCAGNASRIRLRPRDSEVHISRGRTVLAMDRQGSVSGDSAREGLFVYQTRTLCRYRWTLDGQQPSVSAQSAVEQHSWLGYYFQAPSNCKQTPTGECDPSQQTIELKVARVVGEGMHEDVELTNHTQIATTCTLSLEVETDFVSSEEARKGRKQRGPLTKRWEKLGAGQWRWSFDYKAKHHYDHQGNRGIARMQRGLILYLHADSEPSHSARKISFRIRLRPHQSWKACLKWQATVDGNLLPIEQQCNALLGSDGEWFRKQQSFLTRALLIHTPASRDLTPTVQRALDRARLDLASLRLFDLDDGDHNWKLAAGIPSYQALFGRDMLAASWQASMLSTDMSRGALSLMATTQATETNNWRDAQPGRMLHESHTDPLSVLNFRPQALYYGSANTSLLFPIVAAEVWHWTGDKDLVRPYIKPAIDALAWADKYMRDENGFYKYRTRSSQGLKNQGWKDSSDAIVYPDGSQVEDPLGTCEMQAFAYAAKVHFAGILWWLDEVELARRLFHDAEELRSRFNEHFWMDDEKYVAMAINKDDQLVRSISSDAGHCLLSGILETECAGEVVNRMMQPDLFSGWGVRTLSSAHPAYNPFAYHRGTVWPVENAAFVLGMARYGLHKPMWELARALFEAAALFEYERLPEVFGGHARDQNHPFPCLYEKADSPQAWSASAPFIALQALLGLYPYAPLDVLFLDPWLPDWLPEITLEDLCVGDARATLRFRRNQNGRTDYEILRIDGDLHVVRQPSPWSLTADWGERVKDAVTSLLPGK